MLLIERFSDGLVSSVVIIESLILFSEDCLSALTLLRFYLVITTRMSPAMNSPTLRMRP